MGRKNQDTAQSAPVAQRVSSGNFEQTEPKETRYVVVRDGHRVSAHEYADSSDERALDELSFWKLVERNHSWGALVEIVKYDNRLHRVFTIN